MIRIYGQRDPAEAVVIAGTMEDMVRLQGMIGSAMTWSNCNPSKYPFTGGPVLSVAVVNREMSGRLPVPYVPRESWTDEQAEVLRAVAGVERC